MAIDIRMNFSQYDALGQPLGVDGILKVIQKYNLEKAVLLSSMAASSDFGMGNKELFEALKSDNRLYGYLVVNPNYPDESIQLMRTAMTSPKFLAIALCQGATTPYPNATDYADILNAYRRFAKPVFIQTSYAEGVAAAEQIACEFPTIKFVFGSMGGEDWKRALACEKIFNVMLETSGSYDVEKIEEAVEHFGPNRVLYGSNFPFADPASMLALIQSSNISKEAMAKILGDNAKKLFRLDGSSPQPVVEEETE